MLASLFNPERWVVTGLVWAAMAYPLSLWMGMWDGEVVTTERLLTGAGIWAVGGLGFGLTMRSIHRWTARRAR